MFVDTEELLNRINLLQSYPLMKTRNNDLKSLLTKMSPLFFVC